MSANAKVLLLLCAECAVSLMPLSAPVLVFAQWVLLAAGFAAECWGITLKREG